MEQTEYWIRPGQGKAIALIHGIGATDPQAYWQDFLSVLTHDKNLDEFGVFVWKYPTHVQPGSMRNAFSTITRKTLRETAPSLAQLGATWDTAYHAQFQGYQDVVLVCHSMGGLVVKSWILNTLEQGQSKSLATLRHIAFYATPHQGAPVTTLASWNKQLKDMQLNSPFIEDVSRRWYDHVVAWKEHLPGPADERFNCYIPHLVLAGLNDAVVPSQSATIHGIPLTSIIGDHSQVIQPIDSNDTRYKVWRTHLDNIFKMTAPKTNVSSPPDHQWYSEHTMVPLSVSHLSSPVVEVSEERGGNRSISLEKASVLSSTKSQQLLPFQPSTHMSENREYAEYQGWEYVTYETQRSFGNALMSRQLGPSDVEACPQLPEVTTVLQHLMVTYSAIIKGKSGSGKTITAYQAAYAMYKQGWKVLRLAEPHHPADELIDGISHLPQRAILILDNAQSLGSGLVRHLLERSTDNLAVIVVSTEDVVHPLDSISIAGSRAVTVLAQAVQSRKKEILPIIKTLDPRIGEGFSDTPLERRIEEAAKCETPWQFNFVLSGGERQANNILAKLRDTNRADLLLAVIAVGQIITLDEGVSRAWLERTVQLLGRDQSWLEESLQVLQEQRVIFGKHYYRCSHLRFSIYVLRIISAQSSDAEWNNLVTIIGEIFTWQSTPLRGISWLLNELFHYEVFALQQKYNTVITSSNWQQIFERCWKSASDEERRDAAFVLDALIDWYLPHRQAIVEKTSLLVMWIENAEGNASFGLGTLLNSLGQGREDAKQMTETMCEQINPHVIATKLSQVKWSEVAGWSHLIGRLLWASSKKWCKQFDQIADFSFIEALVDTMSITDVYAFSELLINACGYHPERFLGVYERAIPTLVDAFHANVTEAYGEVHVSIWSILGYGIFRNQAPSTSQRRVAKKLVNALQPQIIAKALSYAPQRDWSTCANILTFIKEASPKHAVKIAELIDFVQLDESTQGLWKHSPHELLQFILSLSILPDHNPAFSWVTRHTNELGEINVVLAYVTPQIVVDKLRAGNNLPLTLFWPELTTLALRAIATIDSSLAVQIIESSISKIAEGLSELQPYNCKGVATLLTYLHSLSPTIFRTIIKEVDPEKARENWGRCLQEKTESKKVIAMIFAFSQPIEGSISEIINQLQDKYPKASVFQSVEVRKPLKIS